MTTITIDLLKTASNIKELEIEHLNKQLELNEIILMSDLFKQNKFIEVFNEVEGAKKKFSNEDIRKAELNGRLYRNVTYLEIEEKIKSLKKEIGLLEIEIRYLNNILRINEVK